MTQAADTPLDDGIETLRSNRGWMIAVGIGMLILGAFAMSQAVATTIVSVWLFGVVMIVGAFMSLFAAFRATGWGATLTWFAGAITYGLAGILIVMNPIFASDGLTLFFAVAVLASGVARVWTGFQGRNRPSAPWMILSGMCSILLGVIVLSAWPGSSLWVFGLLIAVELFVQGATYLSLGLALGRKDNV